MIVTAKVLNVRSGPGTTFRVLRQVFNGATVEVAESSGDWAWIEPAGGWVSRAFLAESTHALKVPHGLTGIIHTFGNPGTEECRAGRVKLPAPLKLSWADARISQFACHIKVEKALAHAFQRIYDVGLWEHLKEFGGCYNDRPTRGGQKKSTHAWGIAVDLNPATNQMGSAGELHAGIVRIFEEEGFYWGGRFTGRSRDPMHFQYATGY